MFKIILIGGAIIATPIISAIGLMVYAICHEDD